MISIVVTAWYDPGACPSTAASHEERRAHFLDHLAPMREMAHVEHEVIVVSNGLPSYSAELAEHPAIDRVLANQENRGCVHGRRDGAKLAGGSHLLFLDDDFEFTHGWLARMLALQGQFPARIISGWKWQRLTASEVTERWERTGWAMDNCMLISRKLFDAAGALDNCPPSRLKPFWRALSDLNAMDSYIPLPHPCHHWGNERSTFFERIGSGWRCVWHGPGWDPSDDQSGVFPNAGPR